MSALRKWLAGRKVDASAFRRQTNAFDRAQRLVRCYYAAMLYFALALLPEWPGLIGRGATDRLWPVKWLGAVEAHRGTLFILSLFLSGTVMGAIFPRRRWARILAFLGIFEFVALNNSLGKIGHSLHLWVLTSALLIFLPRMPGYPPSRITRQKYLTVFWAGQAMILLTYTMAGVGKVVGVIYQISMGQNHALMPNALAEIVANRLIETNSQSLLGPALINHPLVGWPMFLADIYLQFFAIMAAFRPSLLRLWAVGLILFHIFSYLLLTINFAQSGLLVALFILNSPFIKNSEGLAQALEALPLIGFLFRRRRPLPCAS